MHNNPDDAWYHGIDQANRDYHNAGGGKQGLPAYKRGMDNALTDYNIAKAKESGSGAGSSWSCGASNAGTSATGAGAGLLLVGHAAFNAAFPEAKSHAAGRRSIPGLFAA